MCELFGLCSDHRVEINSLLRTFFSKADQHPHGWGTADIDGSFVRIIKEPECAAKSELVKMMLEEPVLTHTYLAHIRYATVGHIEYVNCHPFTASTRNGRRITLVHNGTIFHSDEVSRLSNKQKGDTDSERVLLYFAEVINNEEREVRRELTFDERFDIYGRIIEEITPGNKLNLIFYDGDAMYAHSNYKDTMYYLIEGGTTVIATEPLTDDRWVKMPLNRLIAFRNGRMVVEGARHKNEYKINAEDMKYLYGGFSCL